MGIPVDTATTYRAVLAPVYPDGRPITMVGVNGPDRAKAEVEIMQFGHQFKTQNTIVRLMLGAIDTVAWLAEHLPNTRIEPVERYGEVMIVATFASETDAAAFKTRWS